MGKKLKVCFAVIILFSALFAALSFAQAIPKSANRRMGGSRQRFQYTESGRLL
jgi:hypothetical protein